MEKQYYSCDVGSIVVVAGATKFYFNNGYGDGDFKAYKMTEKEWQQYIIEHQKLYGIHPREYERKTLIMGECCVLGYDCVRVRPGEPIDEYNIIFKFYQQNRIWVYKRNQVFYFVYDEGNI